jgi:uncharacterized membrane protein YuzA (DUF378 family)
MNNLLYIRFFLIFVILLGIINIGIMGLDDINGINYLTSTLSVGANLERLIYIIIFVAGIIYFFRRNTFYPFLGQTVMPPPLIDTFPCGDTITKTIKKLPPNVKVIYWASLPADVVVSNPQEAYGNYINQGVTTSDDDGIAILTVLNPAAYIVPFKGKLKPHIHYRYWINYGMTSELKTIVL